MTRVTPIAGLILTLAWPLCAADKAGGGEGADTKPNKGPAPLKERVKRDRPAGGGKEARPLTGAAAPAGAEAPANARDAKDTKAAKAGAGGKGAKDGDEAHAEGKPRDAGAVALAKDEDYIETTLGNLIYGKIHKELPEYVLMILREDQGRIRVPRETIKTINFSMGTRLAALDKYDFVGQYKVGLWAMEKNMNQEAIGLFEKLKALRAKTGAVDAAPPADDEAAAEEKPPQEAIEKIPDDVTKQLGKAYEARQQLDKALENYKEYLQGHADDAEIAAVASKLQAIVNPKAAEPDPVAAAGPAKPKHVDGLEADGNWQAEKWDNANPTTVQFTADKEGNKMLVIQSDGGTKDKMAFSRYGQALNLSDSKEMIFKAFNDSEKPVNMAIAFINAEGDFHESHQTRVMPKQWVKMTYKVEGKQFKSNRNDFKEYNQELKSKEHVARITFMIYDQRPVKLFLDSLFFN